MTSKVLHLFPIMLLFVLVGCGSPDIQAPVHETGEEAQAAEGDHSEDESNGSEDTHTEAEGIDDHSETGGGEATVEPSGIPTEVTIPPTTIPAMTEVSEVSAGEDEVIGDAANGAFLFTTNGCNACHNVDNPNALVGPSLQGVKDHATHHIGDQSIVDYLHESIVDPNAFIVEGFSQGLMPQTFGVTLSEQQINDLIAYLLTL